MWRSRFSCVYPFNVVSMGGACCLNVEELLNHAGQTWGLRKGYSTRRRMDTQHCSIWLKLYTLLLIIYIYIYIYRIHTSYVSLCVYLEKKPIPICSEIVYIISYLYTHIYSLYLYIYIFGIPRLWIDPLLPWNSVVNAGLFSWLQDVCRLGTQWDAGSTILWGGRGGASEPTTPIGTLSIFMISAWIWTSLERLWHQLMLWSACQGFTVHTFIQRLLIRLPVFPRLAGNS